MSTSYTPECQNPDGLYETSSLDVAAYLRMRGVPWCGLRRDGNRNKMVFDTPHADGFALETAFLNSDFLKYSECRAGALDYVKRR